jgi:hypothetical protein
MGSGLRHHAGTGKGARVHQSLKTVCLVGAIAGLVLGAGCATGRDRAAPAPDAGAAGGATTAEEHPGFMRRLATALGGDNSTPNVGPCPAVRVLYDASRFVELTGPARFENVGFTGEINGVRADCRYVRNDPIKLEMQIDAAYGRGPQAAGQAFKDVVYWVAVTQIVRSTDSVTGQLVAVDIGPLARERFSIRVPFPQGQSRVAASTQPLTVTIPRASATTSGENFEVVVGFELTDAQLQMNRDGVRFRIDSGPQ